MAWSWKLIIFEFMVMILSRMVGTLFSIYIVCLCKVKPNFTFKESIFIGYSGFIRGTISLALLNLGKENEEEEWY